MMESKAKSVASYLLELLAGLVAILGVLMLVAGVIRVHILTAIVGALFIAAAVIVFKWPSRTRRAR
jgi:hypothetical protein